MPGLGQFSRNSRNSLIERGLIRIEDIDEGLTHALLGIPACQPDDEYPEACRWCCYIKPREDTGITVSLTLRELRAIIDNADVDYTLLEMSPDLDEAYDCRVAFAKLRRALQVAVLGPGGGDVPERPARVRAGWPLVVPARPGHAASL